MFTKFFKDPFFHFMFAALLIYLLYAIFGAKQEMKEPISISEKEIEALKLNWKEAWKRPPTDAELKSLKEKKLQDELLFDESIAMGLHKEDSVIYDRLIAKTKYLYGNININQKPDEAQLQVYYTNHIDHYRKEGQFSFSHLFISTEHDNPIQKANEMFVLLQETRVDAKDIDKYGDSFSDHHIKNATKDEIVKTFGLSFYLQLSGLKKLKWCKPIISNQGIHVVYISEHRGGEVAPYEEVRDIVAGDFIEDIKKERYDQKLKTLMDQ